MTPKSRSRKIAEVAGSDPDGGIGLSRWISVHHVTVVMKVARMMTEEVPEAENGADSRRAAVTQTATSGKNSRRTGLQYAVVLIGKRIQRILLSIRVVVFPPTDQDVGGFSDQESRYKLYELYLMHIRLINN